MAKMLKLKNARDWAPDLDKWPEKWMGMQEDLEYGQRLLPIMEQFLEYLGGQDLSRKVLKDFADHLWLLGGTIIKEVSIYRGIGRTRRRSS